MLISCLREFRSVESKAELSIPLTSSIVCPITASLTFSEAKELPAPRKTMPRIIINPLLYLMKLIIFCIMVLF